MEIKEKTAIEAFLEMRYQYKTNGVKKFDVIANETHFINMIHGFLKRQVDLKNYIHNGKVFYVSYT